MKKNSRSNRLLIVVLGAVLMAGLLQWGTAASGAEEASSVFIQGVTLIDGTGNAPIENASILIEGGKISRIGREGELTAPRGSEVYDGQGQVVVPGLIDGHIHYRDWVGELFLAHGVTSVVDLGNLVEWVTAVRDAIDRGKIRGPRLFTSGPFIDGGTREDAFRTFTTRVSLQIRNHAYADTVEEARTLARRLIEENRVDTLKVYQDLTADQLAAIVEEAEKHGLVVTGHSDNVQESVEAGIHGITHLWGIAASVLTPEKRSAYLRNEIASPYAHMDPELVDELIDLLVRNNVYVNPLLEHEHKAFTGWAEKHQKEDFLLLENPTLDYIPLDAKLGMLSMYYRGRNYAARFGERFPRLELMSAAEREEFRRGYEKARDFTYQFVSRGGKLSVGTDSAGGAKEIPGLALLQEMEVLAEAGLSPMQILLGTTKNNAELFGLDQLGTLEPGKLADLVILDANPLDDISNIRKIVKVMKGGSWVDTSYHSDYSISIPDPTRMHLGSGSYYPRPLLYEVTPRIATVDSPQDVTITLWGHGFLRSSAARLNGQRISTRFIDGSTLEAVISSDFLTKVGTLWVDVVNPRPGGGTSGEYGFIVNYRTPTTGAPTADGEGRRE